MEFAERELKRYGWKKGNGLGKNKHGRKDHVKVKIKNDKLCIGHDPGKEYTFHWWDHLYNKTANKIKVNNDEDTVKINTRNDNETKNAYKKKMLYSNFRQSGTLVNGSVENDESVKKEDNKNVDEIPKTSDKEMLCLKKETFENCQQLTTHPAARYGIKMNGKLRRLEQQEMKKVFVENGPTNCEKDKLKEKKKKNKRSKSNDDKIKSPIKKKRK